MGNKLRHSDNNRVYFRCPACGANDNKHEELHVLRVRPDGVHDETSWGWNGDNESPSFAPSIKVAGGPKEKRTICHSWITNGMIRFEMDSTHAFAGKTLSLPDMFDFEEDK